MGVCGREINRPKRINNNFSDKTLEKNFDEGIILPKKDNKIQNKKKEEVAFEEQKKRDITFEEQKKRDIIFEANKKERVTFEEQKQREIIFEKKKVIIQMKI